MVISFQYLQLELLTPYRLLEEKQNIESTEDLFGMARPSTSSKKSWGAIQVTGAIRETTTVHGGSASVKLPDAGEQFLMRVPSRLSVLRLLVSAIVRLITLEHCHR